MITPLQQARTERATAIAASAARQSTKDELEEWTRSRNAILRTVAAAELSRRRDVQAACKKSEKES